MTFFRTVEHEAQERADLELTIVLEGIPLYIHKSLVAHFVTHPLILATRGPRLSIEKDAALAELERALLRNLADDDERNDREL